VDEVFIKIRARQNHLWRAVHQDGEVVDLLARRRRHARAAERFLRKVLVGQGQGSRRVAAGR
jgi:putative transposase